ncbi:MAG: TPM domain-containing protein [Acidobacteriota bacterium]
MRAGTTWNPAGEQAAMDIVQLAGLVGGAIFAALLVFFILRAILRQRRYRVVNSFTEDDRQVVRDAVAAAEKQTVGEILPVVVERSDPHPGADWLAALCFLLVGSGLLAGWMPWDHPVLLLTTQFAMGALGFALARLLPDFKRLFIFEDRASAVAEEQAFQEFFANGLHRTEAATGVLLFVSLLERRVIVLADEGIDAHVDADFWAGTSDLVLDGVRRRSLRDGLVAGIQRAGERLSELFPWQEGDRNEIPDRVIVRRE